MDVGGTTCDIGVLAKGFPRESTLSIDIGGVRTNFRMPDILAIGLGGGTRIHLDPARYESADIEDRELRVGPDSVGFHISSEEHTSELQSLMRISYAVFCFKKKTKN